MKPKKQNPQDLQTLKEVWHGKLQRSGFEDIERDELRLKTMSNKFNTDMVRRNWHAKSEYYSMAGQFLHNYQFKTRLERIIWEYHANGLSIRDIAKILKKVKITSIKRGAIFKKIKKLTVEMYKMYMPDHK